MLRAKHLLGVMLVAIGLSACAHNAERGQTEDPFTGRRTTLVVENNNWMDMTLYLVREGMRSRIGLVPSLGRSRFVLSEAVIGNAGQIRILADPIGSSRTFLTEPILVRSGQQVRFRLENNMQLSSYSVF